MPQNNSRALILTSSRSANTCDIKINPHWQKGLKKFILCFGKVLGRTKNNTRQEIAISKKCEPFPTNQVPI